MKDLAEEVLSFSWKLELWYVQFLMVSMLKVLQNSQRERKFPQQSCQRQMTAVLRKEKKEPEQEKSVGRPVRHFSFSLWLKCILMGNAHLTIWTCLSVVSFKNMSEANWFLPRSLLSPPSQNGQEFPRGLGCPSPVSLHHRTWQQCHQQHQEGARGWAASPRALDKGSGQALRKQKPFHFHYSHSYGK